MIATTAHERRTTLVLALALTVATLSVAAVVRIGWAADVRATLAFPFDGVPARPETAGAILAHNALLLGAIIAGALLVQHLGPTSSASAHGRAAVALLAAIDTVLALEVTANVLIVGAALGAYGARMLVALLPHGPVELAAFARALALYRSARQSRQPARRIAVTGAACLAALALAAALETFAAP
jgi:hypothetical protein